MRRNVLPEEASARTGSPSTSSSSAEGRASSRTWSGSPTDWGGTRTTHICVPSASRRSGRIRSGTYRVSGKTTFEELWKPLFVAFPSDAAEPPSTPGAARTTRRSRRRPPHFRSRRTERSFSSRTRDSSRPHRTGHPRRWTSPVHHTLVFSTQEMQQRYDQTGRDAGALMDDVPPYGGNEWLTLQFSRSSKLFRRSCGSSRGSRAWSSGGRTDLGLAVALAGAAALVVGSQALAIYTIIELPSPSCRPSTSSAPRGPWDPLGRPEASVTSSRLRFGGRSASLPTRRAGAATRPPRGDPRSSA